MTEEKNKLIVFEGKKVRRIWHNEDWYFSVVDIVAVLTDSTNPGNYRKVLKHREPQLVTICNQLKLPSSDGKYYKKASIKFCFLGNFRENYPGDCMKFLVDMPLSPKTGAFIHRRLSLRPLRSLRWDYRYQHDFT